MVRSDMWLAIAVMNGGACSAAVRSSGADSSPSTMSAGPRRPCARDAAFVPNRLWCSRQEEKEGAPRLGIAAGVDRELADEMTVQQRGELDHGCVRPERGTIVEQQAVGQDGES